jgi:L-ascorbate oxidase
LPDLMRDLSRAKTADERDAILSDRLMWAEMRMDPSDIADVTGYTFLVNGRAPTDNWTALFKPGERVRLRFIDASSMTLFDVRIPGLRLSVVQADGNAVKPVTVDALRIGPGETYDVIVEPREDRAYTIAAESIDRRGFAQATLAPRPGMVGPAPEAHPPALLAGKDMPMAGMGSMQMAPASIDHNAMGSMQMGKMPMDKMQMDHMQMDPSHTASPVFVLAPAPDVPKGMKMLSYADLHLTGQTYAFPVPGRTITVRLTGNMDRYIWSFDDKKYSEQPALHFTEGETVRLVLRNETMMNHPIHLHGLWMVLENSSSGSGDADRPRKHTVIVPPGGTVTVDVTMAAVGRWPFHCHLLFHMEAGMFREFVVHPRGEPLPVGPSMPADMTMSHAHHH